MSPVCIGLIRSHAIPGKIVIICIKPEHHAKLRHIRKSLDRIIHQFRLDCSITENRVGNLTFTCRCCRHKISIRDCHGIVFFFHFRWDIIKHAAISVADIHARDLPLCIARRCHASVIIVNRCPPEIRHRDLFNHFFPRIAVGNKSPAQHGKQAVKIFAFYSDVYLAVNHADRLFGCMESRDLFINLLSKSDLMSCICPAHILL